MTKTKDNAEYYTKHYPDPTAGKAINNIEREANRRKMTVLELEFESFMRKKLKWEGITAIVCPGSTKVARWLDIKLRQGTEWIRRVEVISPKGWGEFELRYEDIRRKAGLRK